MNFENQTINVDVNGVLPYLKKKEEIVMAKYTDLSPRNLNYPGWLIQKKNDQYLLMPFYQSETKEGYSVIIGDVIHVFKHKPILRECFQKYVEHFNKNTEKFSNEFLAFCGREGEINLSTVLPITKEFAVSVKIKEIENLIKEDNKTKNNKKQLIKFVYVLS